MGCRRKVVIIIGIDPIDLTNGGVINDDGFLKEKAYCGKVVMTIHLK